MSDNYQIQHDDPTRTENNLNEFIGRFDKNQTRTTKDSQSLSASNNFSEKIKIENIISNFWKNEAPKTIEKNQEKQKKNQILTEHGFNISKIKYFETANLNLKFANKNMLDKMERIVFEENELNFEIQKSEKQLEDLKLNVDKCERDNKECRATKDHQINEFEFALNVNLHLTQEMEKLNGISNEQKNQQKDSNDQILEESDLCENLQIKKIELKEALYFAEETLKGLENKLRVQFENEKSLKREMVDLRVKSKIKEEMLWNQKNQIRKFEEMVFSFRDLRIRYMEKLNSDALEKVKNLRKQDLYIEGGWKSERLRDL